MKCSTLNAYFTRNVDRQKWKYETSITYNSFWVELFELLLTWLRSFSSHHTCSLTLWPTIPLIRFHCLFPNWWTITISRLRNYAFVEMKLKREINSKRIIKRFECLVITMRWKNRETTRNTNKRIVKRSFRNFGLHSSDLEENVVAKICMCWCDTHLHTRIRYSGWASSFA